jgi:hypothetical protein
MSGLKYLFLSAEGAAEDSLGCSPATAGRNPRDIPKNGFALAGRKKTSIMLNRWLVKTDSGICVVGTPHLAPLRGASLGVRRFLGFRLAASGGTPDFPPTAPSEGTRESSQISVNKAPFTADPTARPLTCVAHPPRRMSDAG